MTVKDIKAELKALKAENRKSLRTSEHLALTKQIMKLESQLEELK